MAKKIILAAIIIILVLVFFIFMISNDSVDIYMDGENVSVSTHTLNPKIDTNSVNKEICNYTFDVMNDTTTNISTFKAGIENLCYRYGLENPKITIDSSIGENQIPVIVYVEGTSMLPTLQDGQRVLVNKTHNINVGDIVVADSDEYGGIIKRVGQIDGDKLYLESDNKNVDYELINGSLYEVKGITTWVNINDTNGVVIYY